jgi:glutathione S-transferase
MITLFAFGPAFGLPDPSPFVIKTQMLLRMAGVPYRTDTGGFRKAPKGKLPYIEDDGELVADSTFIRWHIERKYGVDFDRGLDARERAMAWAFERMAEEHLYWALVDARWMDDENFARGPAHFFDTAPAPLRPFIRAMVRREVRRTLHGQGTGRHTKAEIAALGERSIAAMAGFLADRSCFMSEEPTGVDATMFAFAAGLLCPLFSTPLHEEAMRHDNLKRYVQRMAARYYPELDTIAGLPLRQPAIGRAA